MSFELDCARIISALRGGTVALGTILLLAEVATASVPARVAIIKSSSIPPFEQATTALVELLRRSPVQSEVLTFNLEGAPEKAPAILLEVRRDAPKLLITVGSLATDLVLRESWQVPVVFSMVLDPAQSGFVTRGGQAVTGASLNIPLDVQFGTLKRMLPQARRVGVLYNPGETGEIVASARTIASRHGLTLEAVEIADPGAAVGALAKLDAVDVVWAVADSHVFTPQTTAALILAALHQHVPLMGLSTAQVRTGALAALSCEYPDVGTQTGEIALRVLSGENALDIPPSTPRKVGLALNLRTAQYLAITIPPELEREAVEVIR